MLQVRDPSVLYDRLRRSRNPQSELATSHLAWMERANDKVYTTRVFRKPKNHAYGTPVSCDFGEARIGTPQPYTEIQPEIYKAPEILVQFIRMGPCGRYLECRLSGKSYSFVPCGNSWYAEPDSSCGRCWRLSICSMVPTVRDCTTIAAT
jgi:hypothetical protein